MAKFKLFTDGGSRGNPGPAAAGIILKNNKNEAIKSGGKYLGICTNNVAEYHALVLGLKTAIKLGIKKLECYLDSELIVKQLTGAYRVKDKNLKKFYDEIKILEKHFDSANSVEYRHIPRDQNEEADAIVNKVLDAATAK